MVLGKHEQKQTINLTINGAEIRGQNPVTLMEVAGLLGQKEKEALVNTFLYSNFNCCSLVLNFSTGKTTNKIEKIQEFYLKLFYNTTETYSNLLIKTQQLSMEARRLRTLATEIFKTLNDKDPNYMK